MVDLNITSNVRQVERGLSTFARRQLPFAVALAINATLKDIKRNTEKRLRQRLDRPARFTLMAFAIRFAAKRKLRGSVFAKDKQAAYLTWAESGGTRTPKGRAIVVPVGQRLNKHGNMPKGAIKRVLNSGKAFSGVPRGGNRPGGIYQRMGRGGRKALRLLIHYTSRADYRKRLGFQDGARKTANKRLPHHLYRAMARALRTAR